MKAQALKVTLNKKVTLSNIIKLLRLVSDRSLFISCRGGGGCRDNHQPDRLIAL